MKRIVIIGAGISGLMAARYFQNLNPAIYERSSNIPMFHDAVMRFKDEKIGLLLGIPVRETKVIKQIFFKDKYYSQSNVYFSNSYSIKTNGSVYRRSIDNIDGENIRYVTDIGTKIECPNMHLGYNLTKVTKSKLHFDNNNDGYVVDYDYCISTIPMPQMVQLINGIENSFVYQPITVIRAKLKVDCDVEQTVYFPDLDIKTYRVTLSSGILIVEMIGNLTIEEANIELNNVEKWLGIGDKVDKNNASVSRQKYGKLGKIDDDKRRAIIFNLSEDYNIFSLGRFATWNVRAKTEDVMGDLEKIGRMFTISEMRRKYEGKFN